MPYKNVVRWVTVTAALGALRVASAAPALYFDQDLATTQSVQGTASLAMQQKFLAEVGAKPLTENFEGIAAGTRSSTTTPIVLDFGGALKAELSGSGCVDTTVEVDGQCNDPGQPYQNPGRWATSPERFWEVSSGGFDIDFDQPVSAFGFFGTDIGDYENRLIVTLTDTDGTRTAFEVPHATDRGLDLENTLIFWGFRDGGRSYTKVSFSNNGTGGDIFGFDDMIVVAATPPVVPEPGSAALAALGLATLLATRRRRRA